MARAAHELHCWNVGPEIVDDLADELVATVCMLPAGHDGPCRFESVTDVRLCLAELEERYDRENT